MADILIRGASAVVTGDVTNTVLRDVDVLVRKNTIVQVGPDIEAASADIIDARGAIVSAGLIDTHLHMWEYGWRAAMSRAIPDSSYFKLFWPLRPAYTPIDTYDATYGCGLELLDHGVTSVLDFFHGANSTAEHADAALAAHRETGQRVLLTYGSIGAYTGTTEADFEEARLAQIAAFERLSAITADLDDPIEIGLALITPLGNNWAGFTDEILHARRLGAQMTFHANETGEFTRMAQEGLLAPDIVPAHGTRASQPELKALAEAGMIVSITPHTETTAGKSLGVVHRGIPFGVDFALGIDTPPGISPLNLFTQAKLMFNYLRLLDGIQFREGGRYPQDMTVDPPTASTDDVWRMATVNGARAFGLEASLGTIEAGRLADIIVVRPYDPDVHLDDPAWYLVHGQPSSHEVDAVIVDGVVKKRDGKLVGVDLEAVRERNRALRQRVLGYISKV